MTAPLAGSAALAGVMILPFTMVMYWLASVGVMVRPSPAPPHVVSSSIDVAKSGPIILNRCLKVKRFLRGGGNRYRSHNTNILNKRLGVKKKLILFYIS